MMDRVSAPLWRAFWEARFLRNRALHELAADSDMHRGGDSELLTKVAQQQEDALHAHSQEILSQLKSEFATDPNQESILKAAKEVFAELNAWPVKDAHFAKPNMLD